MRAVVLVGGEGTRLRPLTYRIPKQLLPVVEVPMLVRLLGALERFGVDDVVLSMGYQPDAFRVAFPDGRCGGVSLDYAVEPEPLDTGGGIAFAARHAGVSETFLVVNGDVLNDFDLDSLVRLHRDRGAEATIALTPVPDPSDFGLVVCGDDGKVSAFVESGEPRDSSMGNRINAGVYVFEPSMLDRLPPNTRLHIETSVFPAMATEGVLFAREMAGWWIDVGNRERYLQATADLLASPSPAPGAAGDNHAWTLGTPDVRGAIDPPVLVADGARLDPGATLSRSVLGAGAVVEGDAIVEGSVVLAGAVIGVGAAVRRSIVGPGASVGAGAVVEDRILACDEVVA
jgi:mannose-1-phosphate guanylyltransferase